MWRADARMAYSTTRGCAPMSVPARRSSRSPRAAWSSPERSPNGRAGYRAWLHRCAILRPTHRLLAQLEREQSLAPRAIDLIPIIETAGGLTNLDGILGAGTRVKHVAFGAGDFTLDVNMEWSRTEAELGFARARIATASRAAGIE